ncbi:MULTISPECIES: DUF5686 and carboxypeptidase regulatory-like domain-containing protein [Niastella]|uniref:Carboxypeptidase-like regulatory domain-containing protein n=1 Tax=Niastella soli TaxID=2821487 RepID=A0ABS3Z562_9BACT|nr:DUF5686 and carboxypeptidase regulatory-like domain-containing protein [Niastella soli]MBO9205310.1 carboxypeptidase-like regulatory domain-containing protein [Niastella soli]
MNRTILLLFLIGLTSSYAVGQSYKVHGKITNTRLEPLAFASIQVKGWKHGVVTKENGTYELELDPGKYDLVISMIGYKSQVITIIIQKTDYLQNIIMEPDDSKGLSEVVVKGKTRDRSEEIIRQVIRKKEAIQSAAGPYSCMVYIKAVQEDSLKLKGKKKLAKNDTLPVVSENTNPELDRMAMAEIVLQLDRSSQASKEERLGVKRRGNTEGLFFLSTTQGDFNFYNNLIKTRALSETPFLSPISYSGLLAYRFRLVRTERVGPHKSYVISVKPRQISNATVEGEITIADSIWVITHTRLKFPNYHLPEYDFFEVDQQYEQVADTTWMITRQQFTYYSKSNKGKKSGITIATYKDFELHKQFDRKYFGVEISSTAQEAYEKDSTFWENNRTEPLTEKEVRFIHYKDSIYRARHTKVYLDSLDRVINKLTWKKWLWSGQEFNDHEKERHWSLPPLPGLYQPLQFGGTRIMAMIFYSKRFPSRRGIWIDPNVSYGIRNHDINGSLSVRYLYNPFNRGILKVSAGRQFRLIYQGDAWINQIKRSNVYLDNGLGIGHEIELLNGLFLYTDLEIAFRRSVSDYATNSLTDSLFGDVLKDNHAVDFEPYNATYGKIRLAYTPRQRYIREPREKIILGSAWPTFYASLRKGLPGIMNSKVNFDYLEFGIEQEIKLGLAGISNYSVRTGSFINTKDLRLVDYKFQRRGDPLLFMNPQEAFQALDSTFPVFRRFYQGHFLHEFNGALINKIPLLKKLQLREVAGGGFLIAPERSLQYIETFAGIERVFKWPFNPLSKFKLGVYVVGSAANKFSNPVQFKIGITSWNRTSNKWN